MGHNVTPEIQVWQKIMTSSIQEPQSLELGSDEPVGTWLSQSQSWEAEAAVQVSQVTHGTQRDIQGRAQGPLQQAGGMVAQRLGGVESLCG